MRTKKGSCLCLISSEMLLKGFQKQVRKELLRNLNAALGVGKSKTKTQKKRDIMTKFNASFKKEYKTAVRKLKELEEEYIQKKKAVAINFARTIARIKSKNKEALELNNKGLYPKRRARNGKREAFIENVHDKIDDIPSTSNDKIDYTNESDNAERTVRSEECGDDMETQNLCTFHKKHGISKVHPARRRAGNNKKKRPKKSPKKSPKLRAVQNATWENKEVSVKCEFPDTESDSYDLTNTSPDSPINIGNISSGRFGMYAMNYRKNKKAKKPTTKKKSDST
ncbi:uncharacterized protein LOC119687382 [Teleopsis dalmanni]|uniref:uncharacterized protein LOC119687382 n=1 Tax=Teleopsis dalmanni TaxID=139649 RepID=UPI0018CD8E27|nr:uncharacterized protein LOC119687382 [Teleopsis dalmanni]